MVSACCEGARLFGGRSRGRVPKALRWRWQVDESRWDWAGIFRVGPAHCVMERSFQLSPIGSLPNLRVGLFSLVIILLIPCYHQACPICPTLRHLPLMASPTKPRFPLCFIPG